MFNETLPVVRDPRGAVYQPPKQQEKPKKKKDFWTDQISTAGGILGGIAGLPLGILGAGGGSAIGSGLGEALENAIMGEDLGKNVAQEAILGGVMGAGPIKLAKAGLQAVKSGGKQAATEQATRTGGEKLAQTLLGDAWGIKSGAKVSGNLVTPQRANELQGVVQTKIGVPKTANADTVYERTVNFRNSTGEAIGNAIKSASPLDAKVSQSLAEGLEGRFNKVIGGNAANNQVAQDILLRARQATTPAELWELRKSIDDSLINFNRNPASVVPGAEQFAKSARSEINKALNKSVPDIKQLNKSYTDAFDIEEMAASAAKNPKGVQAPGYMGRVGGNVAQRARSGLGQTISSAGNMARGTSPQTSARGIAARGGLYGALTQQGGGSEQPTTPEAPLAGGLAAQYDSDPTNPMFNGVDPAIFGYPEDNTTVAPYSRENLMADIQRDPKNAEKYMSLYASLQEVLTAGMPEEKPLSTTAAKDVSNAQTGLDAVSLIEQQLASDPSLQQRGGVSGAINPLGLVSGLLGTGEYENARAQARDVIGRIRTGAALTADEAKAFDRFLPQPGDSAGTVQQKLAFLRNQFTTVADRKNTGSDLSSALLAAR